MIDAISLPLCLFIDGLDGFDEGEDDLLELIDDLQKNPLAEICLSSRPSPRFGSVFEHSPKLKLQDLTEKGIEKYVADRLRNNPRMEQPMQQDPNRGRD